MMLRALRWILSQIVLVLDRLTAPVPMVRSPEAQARVDEQCSKLALYQFEGCPFCVKVRREIRRLGLKIELRYAQNDPIHRETLIREGGELQVPCLRMESGWMYESSDINEWLRANFS